MAVGGYGFQFDRQPLVGAPPAQAPMAQPDFQPVQDDIATVENLTDNYHNAYQTMKDYVGEMAKEYGVDVTKPNWKVKGGDLMHQAYQKFDAALRIAANDLSQYKKTLEDEDKAVREGRFMRAPGFDPRAEGALHASAQERGFATDLLPQVDAAIKQLAITRMSDPKAVEATEKYKNATMNELDQMVSQGIISPAQADFNKKALFDAMAET